MFLAFIVFGLSAKCEEAGGIDLIVIYNSGCYRMAGRGSLAGLMAYGNANEIVLEMACEVLPVVERTPVLAGVNGTDPFMLMEPHLGATVIGTVSNSAKAQLARDHGCAYPILYSERDFVAEVREITSGQGADVIYDAVGRDTFRQSFEALAIQGHLVSFGQASGDIGPIEIADFATKSATVSRPNFAHYTATAEQVRTITDRLFSALAQGVLKIQARHRYPLHEAAAAQRALEERRTSGATILLP